LNFKEETKKIIKNNKKSKIIIIVLIIFILVIALYNLQFKIFNILYDNGNNLSELIYEFNKSNSKFRKNVNDLFEKQLKNIIDEYKKNEITSEELENKANKFSKYKDSSTEISKIKEQKNNFEQANKYFENKEYEKALKIYNELNNNYTNLTDVISNCKQELKISTISTINELKNEQKYSEAIQILENIKSYYSTDSDIENLLSELNSLKKQDEQHKKELEEQAKENELIENIKSSIKVSKVWTAKPNSAGGVDLYINWKNLSDKVIKYVYFTIEPYNSVNDIVTCTIRHYSKFTAQDDGPFKKGQGTSGTAYYWENAWYNHSIKGANLKSVRIIYMDGDTLDIPEKYIDYIK